MGQRVTSGAMKGTDPALEAFQMLGYRDSETRDSNI
jgi:hypothetical protein